MGRDTQGCRKDVARERSEMSYLLALDQGTTSSRALVVDSAGSILGMEQREFPQLLPRSGEVEHDPEAIWLSLIHI
mgnify:CR=1 FL=1